LGWVRERSFGFWLGIPGHLLQLEIERTHRGAPALDSAYLFLPQGDFEAGPFRIVKRDSRYPDTLAGEDGVFLFSHPEIRGHLFFPLEGRGVVAVDSEGGLVMGADHRGPDDLSGPPIRTKNDLIERIPEANAAGAGSR